MIHSSCDKGNVEISPYENIPFDNGINANYLVITALILNDDKVPEISKACIKSKSLNQKLEICNSVTVHQLTNATEQHI